VDVLLADTDDAAVEDAVVTEALVPPPPPPPPAATKTGSPTHATSPRKEEKVRSRAVQSTPLAC
jgi:hypothetical protein